MVPTGPFPRIQADTPPYQCVLSVRTRYFTPGMLSHGSGAGEGALCAPPPCAFSVWVPGAGRSTAEAAARARDARVREAISSPSTQSRLLRVGCLTLLPSSCLEHSQPSISRSILGHLIRSPLLLICPAVQPPWRS